MNPRKGFFSSRLYAIQRIASITNVWRNGATSTGLVRTVKLVWVLDLLATRFGLFIRVSSITSLLPLNSNSLSLISCRKKVAIVKILHEKKK